MRGGERPVRQATLDPGAALLLAVLMLAVVLLTLQAYVINRLAGIDYPRWSPRPFSK